MFDNKIERSILRKVAGAFPTGVTIITTDKEDGSVHGMTASSFLSVSLDPALVSFCVKETAAIFPLLSKGKRVGISILGANQKEISNQFAGMNEKDVSISFEKTITGASVVDDSLARYGTCVHDIIPAGDHYIILCQVMDLERAEDGLPLVYWSGYRTTGEAV